MVRRLPTVNRSRELLGVVGSNAIVVVFRPMGDGDEVVCTPLYQNGMLETEDLKELKIWNLMKIDSESLKYIDSDCNEAIICRPKGHPGPELIKMTVSRKILQTANDKRCQAAFRKMVGNYQATKKGGEVPLDSKQLSQFILTLSHWHLWKVSLQHDQQYNQSDLMAVPSFFNEKAYKLALFNSGDGVQLDASEIDLLHSWLRDGHRMDNKRGEGKMEYLLKPPVLAPAAQSHDDPWASEGLDESVWQSGVIDVPHEPLRADLAEVKRLLREKAASSPASDVYRLGAFSSPPKPTVQKLSLEALRSPGGAFTTKRETKESALPHKLGSKIGALREAFIEKLTIDDTPAPRPEVTRHNIVDWRSDATPVIAQLPDPDFSKWEYQPRKISEVVERSIERRSGTGKPQITQKTRLEGYETRGLSYLSAKHAYGGESERTSRGTSELRTTRWTREEASKSPLESEYGVLCTFEDEHFEPRTSDIWELLNSPDPSSFVSSACRKQHPSFELTGVTTKPPRTSNKSEAIKSVHQQQTMPKRKEMAPNAPKPIGLKTAVGLSRLPVREPRSLEGKKQSVAVGSEESNFTRNPSIRGSLRSTSGSKYDHIKSAYAPSVYKPAVASVRSGGAKVQSTAAQALASASGPLIRGGRAYSSLRERSTEQRPSLSASFRSGANATIAKPVRLSSSFRASSRPPHLHDQWADQSPRSSGRDTRKQREGSLIGATLPHSIRGVAARLPRDSS